MRRVFIKSLYMAKSQISSLYVGHLQPSKEIFTWGIELHDPEILTILKDDACHFKF
jgi:hypothetical protein